MNCIVSKFINKAKMSGETPSNQKDISGLSNIGER